jgi:CHASE1-domain containing sensor protein
LVVEPLHAALGMKNMFLVLALVLVSASLLAALIPRFSRLQHAAATRSEPALK